jgi:hypothetical protein
VIKEIQASKKYFDMVRLQWSISLPKALMLFIGCKILEQATVQVFDIYSLSSINVRLKVCTDFRRLTRFQVTQFQTYANVINNILLEIPTRWHYF